MKSHQLLSDKDLQILKITYRTVIENFYENSSQENTSNIILLNSLIMQTVSTREQSDSLLLISILEILKVKCKGNKQLSDSIQNTIIHLKNPLKIYLKNDTLLQCLQKMEIYNLTCTVINRFYDQEMKPRADNYNWKQIIIRISKNSDKNINSALQTIVHILPDYANYAKQVSKSGMIKYLCSVHIPQVFQDKNSLYRSLKVLRIVSLNDRSILPGRQKNIALVIYNYPAYILIIQQIQQSCFDQQYCLKVLSNAKDIDPLYVWSYYNKFCSLSSQKTVDQLQNLLKEGGKNIPADLQWKIYTTITNLVKVHNYRVNQCWKIPTNDEKNLNANLKLISCLIDKNPSDLKAIDIKAIEYVYDCSKTSDPITEKLIKDLKNIEVNKKVGKLQKSIFQYYTVDKNPQILMEKAAKIPRNNEQLHLTQQIMSLNNKNLDQLQADITKTLKNKALESLKNSIALRYPVSIWNLFNNLNIETNDPQIINKLLKLGELALSMDPDSAEKYNQNKFLQILEWLQNNHGIHIIDWVAASQILAILFGVDEWKKHISQIPQRSFWILNACDGQKTIELMNKINSIPLTHLKIPLILGFVAKTGDPKLKKLIFNTKLMQQVIASISLYKNSRSSVKTYKPQQDISDGQQMKKYLVNVLNMSYFIYNWSQSQISKQIQSKILRTCLENVIRCFHGYEHQYRFVQNSLPYKLNMNQLKDINIARLLQTHGRLTSYLYRNKHENKFDFNKISTISNETDSQKIEEVLKFLQQNPDMIEVTDLLSLLQHMIRNAKKQQKYWKFFPNYMSILNHITDISTKSSKPELIQKLTEILQKLINGTIDNQDITPQQLVQFYDNVDNGLSRLMQRNIKIDANRLKRQAQKIKDQQSKQKIIEKLKLMNQKNMKMQQKARQIIKNQKVSLGQQRVSLPQIQKGNKYQTSVNLALQEKQSLNKRLQSSNIGGKVLQKSAISAIQVYNEVQQKKDDIGTQGPIDTNQIINSEYKNISSLTPMEQQLLDALQTLKKIILKQQPKETFPKLYEVFMCSEFNKNRRYVLGHLLTQYYQIIEKDKRVILLLQLKDKTNLTKEICFEFLKKFQQVLIISKRWKLIGYDFMDLAVQRLKCRNQNKSVCLQNGCEIIQYNLIKNQDILYFYNKKYHLLACDLFNIVNENSQAIYYILLIGSSARLLDVKTYYISKKMHCSLLDYTTRPGWLNDKRISANLSYALSSLVYTQNHISIQVASRKTQMKALLSAYHQFATTKSVVQSGCSLLSNICYSNKETKELLCAYGINQQLIYIASVNLNKPEVSTYKQIMRTLGNISLHKQSTEKLIDGHICQSIVAMAQKFDILVFRDDQKLKVLKLIVDFFSNIASHKHKLQTLHKEGVTNFVVTILQTTQISQDLVLMACIDTIDGLCQNQQIQNYVVMDKKLLLQLIDLLKIKQDEKLITKSIRLLTNMTLNENCIPYILQANLLSVLANIVLAVYRNQKIETYINKILLRIFAKKPDIKTLLKSGYLDCLIKTIEINEQIDDSYVDILLHYSQNIPNYLNHRTFFVLVKMLTTKINQKQTIDKCFKIIRTIFSSEDKDEEDMLIVGSTAMYERLLATNQANRLDIIYLIGLHCTKSKKFKQLLLSDHTSKKTNTLEYVQKLSTQDSTKQLSAAVLFAILNKNHTLVDVSKQIVKEEDFAYKMLTKGFQCKLFRIDGSSKNAIVDIDEMYMIRAYKYPGGQIKKKYMISIRQLRDWQFSFQPNDQAWINSVYSKDKGVFQTKPKHENCVTLLGTQSWGEFNLINLQFNDLQTKMQFAKAISVLIMSFKV